ncbi:nitric oxide-associated protein 1 [Anopheles moucheti]|uniref:nitric oxide-associated protein 1 n=1 Tax=Anopheles moucheti TaxID=186751 RepID=UPI0022F0F99E|nr:nitric oxide-associated protein 1 [Anopheles moucheti]
MYRSVLKSNIFRSRLIPIARHFQLNSIVQCNTIVSAKISSSDEVYREWKDKIVYSSFIENSTLKLGYKQNKIMESKLKEMQNRNIRKSCEIKPFSVAMKQLQTKEFNELFDDGKISLENAENASVFHMPYKQIGLKVQKQDELADENNDKLFTGEWMSDYEYYDEHDQDARSLYGTPDRTIPSAKVPCGGCGALLHCIEPNIPGYLPSELFKGKSNEQLLTTICQRCHFLKNYNVAINVTVSADDYIEMLSTMKTEKALAILLVDILDFPCSIWPGLAEILGPQRPIIVVGNKIDLLPQDSSGYLENVRHCLTKSIIESGFSRNNIKNVALVSASTGYGVEELITKIHNVWGTRGDVYLVGCTNVGKSTLFNALLRSDLCKVQATDLIQRATASPWPGTTIRMLKFPIMRPSDYRLYLRTNRLKQEQYIQRANQRLRREQSKASKDVKHPTLLGHIGRTFVREQEEAFDHFSLRQSSGGPTPILTLNEKNEKYINSKWCYDTPGVVQPDQILDLLTTEEILLTIPKQMIRPRVYLLKKGMTLFVGGLGRIDFLDGPDFIRLILYASHTLPTVICNTSDACTLYKALLGTQLLGVPFGTAVRLAKFPSLESGPNILVHGTLEKHTTVVDILLSSAGWVGVNLPKHDEAIFRAWTPSKRGIYVRQPALLPNGLALRGKRIRGSLAYRLGEVFKPR